MSDLSMQQTFSSLYQRMRKWGRHLRAALSTTHVIALGFLSAILIGTLLLMLPICAADHQATPLIDCLFTATTCVCVTGLTTVTTAVHWSLIGKIILLILIQLGGLGIVSFTTGVMMIIGSKITLRDRLLLEDALNLDTLSGLVRFLRRIFAGTFLIEGLGAIGYCFVFIPEFGVLRGLWYSVFHSVSAFCNAGIDLLGDSSLVAYATNPWMNFVTMALIIMGGLGFIVWWDILRVFRAIRNKEFTGRQFFKKLRLHSKIVLLTTTVLLIFGTVLIFLLEYHNDATMGTMTPPQKLLAATFESVTLRTAGFFTFPQSGLRDSTIVLSLPLMLIGGSSIGTAGGIKTTTIALLFVSALSAAKGTDSVILFKRRISHKTIQKAMAVTLISVVVLFAAIMSLSIVQPGNLLDIAFEATSAIATVGLSRDFTGSLHLAGKFIIILCMYLGRIGPISLAIFFNSRKKPAFITYPQEDVTVG